MRLILTAAIMLVAVSAYPQALWRNFFTTNQNPQVAIQAGSNTTVQTSTSGNDQRIYTVTVTNNLVLSNLTLNGFQLLSPAWKDIVTHPSALSKGGTATTRPLVRPGGVITVEGWQVGTWGDGELQFNHDLATTNTHMPELIVYPHVHIDCTNVPANTSNTAFSLRWIWANIGESWATCLRGTNYLTNNLTAFIHTLGSFGSITNNGAVSNVSSILTYRIQRLNAGDGDLGDSTGIVRLRDLDFHYPVGWLGSSGPTTY